jgi:hypothetical protein
MDNMQEMKNVQYNWTVLKRQFWSFMQHAKGDCPDRVLSDQVVLGTVRWKSGPHERRPKELRVKITQGGPSGSSPLRSDCSPDGQAGGWIS